MPCALPDVPPSQGELEHDARGVTLDTPVKEPLRLSKDTYLHRLNKEDRRAGGQTPPEAATGDDGRRTPLLFASTPKGQRRPDTFETSLKSSPAS